MQLRFSREMQENVMEDYRRGTGVRGRSRGVRGDAKQTMRFAGTRIRCRVRVGNLRSCEDNQYQDDERRCKLTQLRAVILD